MIEFGDKNLLIWLWLIIPAVALMVYSQKRRIKRLKLFSDLKLDRLITGRFSGQRSFFKGLLLVLSLIFCILALAKPRWGFNWQEVKTSGVDIIIAVDVSKSMMAEDVKPNRLERAKRKVIDLLRMLRGDRVALIAFAGTAFVQCPLTTDYGAIRMFLDYLNPDLIPVQGTAIGQAIHIAIGSLKEVSKEDSSQERAMIIMTDGEDHEESTKDAVAKAKEAGIKIYTMAIGTSGGAPIPTKNGGFKQDAQGNVVLSKPDVQILRYLADETGGSFTESTAGDQDLEQIYVEGIKKAIDDQDLSSQRRKIWHERFQYAVFLGFLFLLLEGFIGEFGASKLALFLVFGFLAVGQSGFAADSRKGQKAYEKGDFAAAEKAYLSSEIDEPDNLEHTYNKAVSQFKQKKYEEAKQGFLRAAESKDKKMAADSLFNLGNTAAMTKKYDESIKAYEDSLKLNPENDNAKENLAYVKQMKEQQQQQQEQNQDQKNQDQQDQQNQQANQNQDQKQNQNQEQKDQQNQENQSQQDQKNQQANKDKQDQQQENQSQKDEQQKKEEEQQEQQAQQSQEKDRKPQDNQQAQQGKQPKPGQLTPEQAEQVLRSVQDQAAKYMALPQQKGDNKEAKKQGKDW